MRGVHGYEKRRLRGKKNAQEIGFSQPLEASGGVVGWPPPHADPRSANGVFVASCTCSELAFLAPGGIP